MGIGLPLVGYVAATSDGSNPTSKPNLNKRVEVDTFMGLVRIAFQEGWADCLLPSGVKFSSMAEGCAIHPKNFEHQIFFDTDLQGRPQLLKAIEFLKSDPAGGSLCVISIDEIKVPEGPEIEVYDKKKKGTASRQMRTLPQCFALRELSNIPILECGRRSDRTSLVHQFSMIPAQATGLKGRQAIVEKLIGKALDAYAANRKRLESTRDSCVLGRLGELSDAEKDDYLGDVNVDLACDHCAARLRGPLKAPPR